MQEYADLKKSAVHEANLDGEKYRKMKEPMFQKFSTPEPTADQIRYNPK